MTVRRALVLLGALLLVVLAYSAWRAWQVQRDLSAAEQSANEFIAALDSDDAVQRETAIEELREHSQEAREGTGGLWWSGFTHLPLVGDDATGVRALARSLYLVADGAEPVTATLGDLDGVTRDGSIDLQKVESLQEPVSDAASAFADAREEVRYLDSSGYAGSLRTRFDDYVERIDDAARNLGVADQAIQVLPTMAGADGPRTYLFVFQNNAEVRGTGGLPGSWSEVRVDDGAIEITRQGSAGNFPFREDPPLPLTSEELRVYGETMGQYFTAATFTPDFPRAAELLRAHYEDRYPQAQLDGVLSLDPVGASYLLPGLGPVVAEGVTLTPDTAVEQLLSDPYQTLTPRQQNLFFEAVARELFGAITGDLSSPVRFVEGLARAGREGRFLVSPFEPEVRDNLAGTRVLGELASDDGRTPHVDVAMNDATGSKMSYYLRYQAEVRSVSCSDQRQQLIGLVTLRQSIRPADARMLPVSVTGGGIYGTTPGEQTVFVQIYGPVGATMSDLMIDGRREADQSFMTIEGRPVYVLPMSVRSLEDTRITWSMTTGGGQDGGGVVSVTPGVVPGSENSSFAATC